MTTPFKLRSGSSPFKKQKLSPKARKAKAARDLAAAKTPIRQKRKAENQRLGQSSEHDLRLKSDGTVVKMTVANNRNVWQHGERTA